MIEVKYENGSISFPTNYNAQQKEEATKLVLDLKEMLGEDTVLQALVLDASEHYARLCICSKKDNEFVPTSKRYVWDQNSSVFEHDKEKGTITYTTFTSGDRNVREHKKGVLADFFTGKTDIYDKFYHFVIEHGFQPEYISIETGFWFDLADLGYEDEETIAEDKARQELYERCEWELKEEANITDPFNHEVDTHVTYRRYACGDAQVYTCTVPVDESNEEEYGVCCPFNEPVCKIYFTFSGLMEHREEDFYFAENERNLKTFLFNLGTALVKFMENPKSSTMENLGEIGGEKWNKFVEQFKQYMGTSVKPGWTQIFKQTEFPDDFDDDKPETDVITKEEMDIITAKADYRRYNDEANGYVAFQLFLPSREDCNDIVSQLNELCEKRGEETNWFLGHEDEEYVDVD